MPEEQASPEAASPVAQGTPEESASTGDVNSEQTGDARPVENWQAEFRRKQERTQQQLDTVLQWIGTMQQQRAPQPSQSQAPQGSPTDEDLWALAQQGDRLAFEEYQRRIAQREVQKYGTTQGRQTLIESQMRALMAKYPVLQDASHPLTQTANAAYHLLVQAGYPQDRATLLEAAKTAIADRPDLVAELHSQGSISREQGRVSATQRAQAGHTGASVRQAPAPDSKSQVRMTPEETKLAQRMGIKDPKGAKERFLKRQDEGRSALGAVAGFVNEGDL